MKQKEFETYKASRDKSMCLTHMPRVLALIEQGMTPIEIVKQMANEGYQGYTCNRFGLRDLHRLQRLAGLS